MRTRRPSVAVGDSRDVASLTAIYALNALVGAYGRRVECSLALTKRAVRAAAAAQGLAHREPDAPAPDIHTLIGAMGGSQIKALLVLDTNPLFTLPEAEKLRRRSRNVPFIASFASFLDESSVMADLILPSHTTLERWVDDVPEPGVGFPVRTLGQPVVEPRWDTRDPGDVLIETAKALGGKAAAGAAVRKHGGGGQRVVPIGARAAGGPAADADFEAFFKKGDGCRRLVAPAAAAVARADGPRPRARADDAPRELRDAGAAGGRARVRRRCGADAVHAALYPSAAFADGRTAHLPWLQEMPDPMTTVMWGSWVEINPETAHKLEIHEGDVLTITSPQGSIELPAFLYPGLRPDVIAIPVGQGHTQFGRYAQNRGANPLRISASALDRVGRRGADRRASERGEDRTERTADRFGASDARGHHEHPLHR